MSEDYFKSVLEELAGDLPDDFKQSVATEGRELETSDSGYKKLVSRRKDEFAKQQAQYAKREEYKKVIGQDYEAKIAKYKTKLEEKRINPDGDPYAINFAIETFSEQEKKSTTKNSETWSPQDNGMYKYNHVPSKNHSMLSSNNQTSPRQSSNPIDEYGTKIGKCFTSKGLNTEGKKYLDEALMHATNQN